MVQLSEVKPGDLITAELMNQIIAEIAKLDARISKLENISISPGLIITGFDPQSGVHVGDPLTIKGIGFSAPPERNIVIVGNSRVQAFNLSSDANNLAFVVPDPKVSLASPVTVTVVNDLGLSASKDILFLPQVIVPVGRVEIVYKDAPSLPTSGQGVKGILGEGEWTFGFNLTTIVTGIGVYRVTPSISATGWKAELLDGNTESVRSSNFITIDGSTTQYIRVRLTVPQAPSATAGTLRLDVVETTPNTQVIPGSPPALDLKIGDPVPLADTSMCISLLSTSNVALSGNRVVFKVASPGAITFNALLTEKGNYVPTFGFSNSTDWTLAQVPPPFDILTRPPIGQPANASFTVYIKAGASASQTDLIVTLTRDGAAKVRCLQAIGVA